MKITLTLVFAFLLSFEVFSIFSSHIIITKQRRMTDRYSPQIKVVKGEEETEIEVFNIYKNSVWLIRTDENFKLDETVAMQGFRELIWKKDEATHKKFHSTGIKRIYFGKKSENRSSKFTLKNSELSSAYLYIDHSKPIEDGGFHYTVDLSSY